MLGSYFGKHASVFLQTQYSALPANSLNCLEAFQQNLYWFYFDICKQCISSTHLAVQPYLLPIATAILHFTSDFVTKIYNKLLKIFALKFRIFTEQNSSSRDQFILFFTGYLNNGESSTRNSSEKWINYTKGLQECATGSILKWITVSLTNRFA